MKNFVPRVVVVASLVATALLTLIGALPSLACPEELHLLETVTVQRLEGRLLPDVGAETMPGIVVEFIVEDVESDDPVQWEVPVLDSGEFEFDLPEGTYVYTLAVKDYFFTISGVIVISDEADPAESLIISAPWC